MSKCVRHSQIRVYIVSKARYRCRLQGFRKWQSKHLSIRKRSTRCWASQRHSDTLTTFILILSLITQSSLAKVDVEGNLSHFLGLLLLLLLMVLLLSLDANQIAEFDVFLYFE